MALGVKLLQNIWSVGVRGPHLEGRGGEKGEKEKKMEEEREQEPEREAACCVHGGPWWGNILVLVGGAGWGFWHLSFVRWERPGRDLLKCACKVPVAPAR